MNGKAYKVWGFRKFHGYFDCGSLDKLEACPSAPGVELTHEEFVAFERAVRCSFGGSDYVYLYHHPDDVDVKVATTVRELVRMGAEVIVEEKAKEAK